MVGAEAVREGAPGASPQDPLGCYRPARAVHGVGPGLQGGQLRSGSRVEGVGFRAGCCLMGGCRTSGSVKVVEEVVRLDAGMLDASRGQHDGSCMSASGLSCLGSAHWQRSRSAPLVHLPAASTGSLIPSSVWCAARWPGVAPIWCDHAMLAVCLSHATPSTLWSCTAGHLHKACDCLPQLAACCVCLLCNLGSWHQGWRTNLYV